MMTDKQKIAIYKWRERHQRQYYEINKAYYEKTKSEENKQKNKEKCRRWRVAQQEYKRFLNILLE